MKAKVPLWQAPQKFTIVDTDATKGATLGVNVFRSDGTVVTDADLTPPAADVSPVSRTMWSLVLSIPANVTALETAIGTGMFAVTGAGTGAFRTLAGTANRVTVANGDGTLGNPTFDIAATYAGQTSITTLGTISTGTWQGGVVAATYGGTGMASYAAGNYINAATTSTLQQRTPAQVFADIGVQAAIDAKVLDSIASGDTTHAPSRNAVALALATTMKNNAANVISVPGVVQRDVDNSYVSISGGVGFASRARFELCGPSIATVAFQNTARFYGDAVVFLATSAVEHGRFNSTEFASANDNAKTLGTAALRWSTVFSKNLSPGAGTVIWTSGTGTPEGVVTAPIGSIFTRTDGGAATTLYVKESGVGNIGWIAK